VRNYMSCLLQRKGRSWSWRKKQLAVAAARMPFATIRSTASPYNAGPRRRTVFGKSRPRGRGGSPKRCPVKAEKKGRERTGNRLRQLSEGAARDGRRRVVAAPQKKSTPKTPSTAEKRVVFINDEPRAISISTESQEITSAWGVAETTMVTSKQCHGSKKG